LRSTDYPADFDVDYPEQLSRGLVLVKSWLLAVPHYLVIAGMIGAMVRLAGDDDGGAAISLFGILVIIVFVALLFTGRYPPGVFDLLLGINRWMWRLRAYSSLLRDEYPPFRLDQGAREPAGAVPAAPADAQ
jgi:hypothetical protein